MCEKPHDTAEAEYIAASEAAKEAIWLHRLAVDFLAISQINRPTPTIYYDSQSAIHLINNPVYHARTKHMGACDLEEAWKIDTEVNITDCLTKPLLDLRFRALRAEMGLRQVTEQAKAEQGAEGKNGSEQL